MPVEKFSVLRLVVAYQVEICNNCIVLECDLNVVASWENSVPVVNDVLDYKGC